MVPFAGYDMPVQYPTGIIKEHLHTRAEAGLFDVSHMGQVIIEGEGVINLDRIPAHCDEDHMAWRTGDDATWLSIVSSCKKFTKSQMRPKVMGSSDVIKVCDCFIVWFV